MLKYKEAFSLRDEIGLCPNMEIELELNDDTPFFIRPFPIKETEKEVVDKGNEERMFVRNSQERNVFL